jgi:hypothetical protein
MNAKYCVIGCMCIAMLLTSCSRTRDLRSIRINDNVETLVRIWGEPDQIGLPLSDEISIGESQGAASESLSESVGNDKYRLLPVKVYCYSGALRNYRVVIRDGIIQKIYMQDDLGSGPWIEMNR